jgi:hypothetical protein
VSLNASDRIFGNLLRVQVNDAQRDAVNPQGEEGVEARKLLRGTSATSQILEWIVIFMQ